MLYNEWKKLIKTLLIGLLPAFTFAQSDGVAYFDAPTESYVDIGSTDSTNCFSNLQYSDELTVTMWVKWDDKDAANVGNWANRLTYADSSGNGDKGTFWCQHDNKNDRFEFALETQKGGRDYIFSTTQPQEGTWYHVAHVYDGALMMIYVNGQLESWDSKTGDLNVSSSSKLNMGRWPNKANNHRFFDGNLDEVSVWNRALVGEEIDSMMQNPESITSNSYDTTGLIGYWDFDDYNAEDKSPCNNHGNGNGSFSTVPAGSDVTRTVSPGDANDPGNWDNGVPNDTVTGIVEDPIHLTGNLRTSNLVLKDSLNSNGDTLVIHEELVYKGQYIPSGGVLEFEGDSVCDRHIYANRDIKAQTLLVDVPSDVELDSGTLKLSEELRIESGTLDVSSKKLTLLSDSTGTARIAPLSSNALIRGEVAVQRHIGSGNAGWIDMGPPNRDNVTLEEWDDDIYLSGKRTGGFDDGCSWSNGCFWSVKRSDSTGALVDVTSTSTPLENGRGYELFIGDDGGVNTMNSDTTVTVKGRVKKPGSFTIDVNDNAWTLVANPYASPIDFDAIGLNNVDPNYAVAAATGSYEYYDRSSGTSSHPDVGPILASSQGFWVKGNGSNASITIQQSYKSNKNASFSKNGQNENTRLTLRDASNGSSSTMILLSGTDSNSYRALKHKKTPVVGAPDLYSIGADSGEVRSRWIGNKEEYRIPLRVVPDEQGVFSFDIEGLDRIPHERAVLVDRSKSKEYELSEKELVQLQLSPSDSGSARFYLRLEEDATWIEEEAGEKEDELLVRTEGKKVFLKKRSGEEAAFRVSVFDSRGKKVRPSEELWIGQTFTGFRTDLSKGIYFLRLDGPEGSFKKKVPIGTFR